MRQFISIIFVVSAAVIGAFGQVPAPSPTPTPALSPAQFVDAARARAQEYTETFRNLIADETKRFVMFGKDGTEKRARVIRSSFLIYQPAGEMAASEEYRNIVEVDGKPEPNVERRASGFFEKLLGSRDPARELEKIRDESTRSDLGIAISGFTLNEAISLWDELRPVMEFQVVGRSRIDGREVIEVTYSQTADSVYITADKKARRPASSHTQLYDIDTGGRDPGALRLSGTLWIDADTYRLRRERRTVSMVMPAGQVPVIEQEFDYQDSDLGILTPRRISHLQYRLDKRSAKPLREVLVTFEYGRFSKPDVEVSSPEKQPD